MSLDEEKRDLVVRMELEKAYRTMKEAEIMIQHEQWNAAAGRVYYAVFHAINALLIHDGFRIKSHKGAYAQFCMHYVLTGRFPKEAGTLYRQLEIMREESDYNCFYDVMPEDLQRKLIPARKLIDDISGLTKSS